MECIINVSGELNQERITNMLSGGQRNLLESEVFHLIKDIFDESADDPEACLHGDGLMKDWCIFGAEKPEKIIEAAKEWNMRIREDFEAALQKFLACKNETGIFPVDNQLTYELKKAAMALDNDFYSYADYATATGCNQYYFKTILTEADLENIRNNPEDYVLATV